ncbi:50S ribosomal protein L18 [Myxococcota bacterium]|nr:50S ribosomal protein L18 [Myxococcota bacterium]
MKRKIRTEKLRKRIARRTRSSRATSETTRPKLTIFRTAKHIYAQINDPETGDTIVSVSTRTQSIVAGMSSTGNIDAATKVGTAVAEAARSRNIEKVVFNRNGFLYHGRVKALADAAREAGLQF